MTDAGDAHTHASERPADGSAGADETSGDDTTTEPEPSSAALDSHLQHVEPGAGCTEIWAHLAEHREE